MTTAPDPIRTAPPAAHPERKAQVAAVYAIGTPDGVWVAEAAALAPANGLAALQLSPAGMDRVARQVDSGAADRGPVLVDVQDIAGWLPSADAAEPVFALCPQGCWVAGGLADSVADAAFVAWVEHPARGLAAALAAGRVLHPGVWLAHWRAGARQLLRLAQLHRNRLLLLDAEEARQQPDAVRTMLHQRWGLRAPGGAAAAPDGHPPPLAAALADWLATSRPDLQALYRELLASCDLLNGTDAPDGAAPPVQALAPGHVVRDYYALRNALQDLQQLRAQHAEADQQAQARALDQQQASDDLQARLDAQAAGLATSQLEAERLARALDEARAMGAESARQAGVAVQQLEHTHTELAQVRQQVQALQARLDHEALAAAQALQRARDETQGLGDALAAARQDAVDAVARVTEQLSGQVAAQQAAAEDAQVREQAASAEATQRAAQLAHLQSTLQQLQRDEAQRQSQAKAQLHAVQQGLDQAELERQSLKEALARLQAQQAELLRDGEVQVQQLHEVQEALEQSERRVHKESQRHASARKDAERHRVALEEAQAQRQASEAHRGAVQAQLDAARDELGAVRKDSAGLRLELAQLQKDVATLKQGSASLERQKQALLADAASLEKEAAALRKESAHQAREAAARARDAAQAQAALQLSRQEVEQTKAGLRFLKDPQEPPIGEARLLTARLDPPYREITVVLRSVQSGARQVPDATVRLVEHHGHPGLAVFAPPGVEPLFASWQESGREANRPYMLLVPTDEKSRPMLEAMDSDDWLLLLTVVRRIEREVRAGALATQPQWLGLAQRLLGQLLAMAPRLRHAGAEPLPSDTGLLLRLRRVQRHAHRVEQLDLRWLPAAGGGRWSVLRGPAAPPLQSWPDSASPGELAVPLGASGTDADRAVWAQLPAADRLFLAAVIDAWPELVSALEPTGLQAAGGAHAAVAAAHALRDEARRHLGPDGALRQALPAPGLLRRAARRLRGGTTVG